VNELPPSQDEPDDADEFYRHASSLDPSRPSESVRQAVLKHAVQLAADRAAQQAPTRIHTRRPASKQGWRRPAIFGTLAVAALAGLLVAPRFLVEPPAAPTPAVGPSLRQDVSAAAPVEASTAAERLSADVLASAPPTALPPAPATAPRAPVARTAAPRVSPGTAASPAMDRILAESGSLTGGLPAIAAQNSRAKAQNFAAPMGPVAHPTDPAAALRRAAEIGDVPGLQTLLDEQVDIEARDSSGRTALMLATLRGQIKAVDTLLAHGADPNTADAQGNTPLQISLAGDEPAIAAALQRAGAR
jgi:Ankyrin repeats (3 copies)